MHIRSFIGVALLCLGTLAFATAAMAAPPNDICFLDLAPANPIDHGDNIAPPECAAVIAAVETIVLRTPGGDDEDEAAGPALNHKRLPLDFGISRQHFDPGRVGI